MSDSTWNQQTHVTRSHAGVSVQRFAVPVFWQYITVIAVLSIFRLGALTHQSLWFDEGYTLNLVSTSTFRDFLKLFGSYTTSEHLQPLYYFIMFAWSRVAGSSDAALRLPSAMFSIGSGICMFAMLRHLATWSTKAYAMLGIGLFSVSSYSVYYAQEARPYACVQFCSFLVLLAWLAQTGKQDRDGSQARRPKAFLVCACVLACFASVFGALLVCSLALADLYRCRRQLAIWLSSWRTSVVASTTIMATYSIFAVMWFPSVVGKDIVALKQPLWMNAAYTIFGTLFGTTIGPSTTDLRGADKVTVLLHALPVLFPAGLIVISIGWAVARIIASSPAAPYHTKVAALAAIIYMVILFGCFGGIGKLNVLPRHASGLFALGIVTLTSCATTCAGRNTRMPRAILWLSLSAAFVLNSMSMIRGIYAPSCRKDDYRATAAFISRQHIPVFLVGGQAKLLEHYGAATRSAVDVDPSQLAEHLLYASARSKQILVVTNTFRNYRWDNKPSVAAVLEPTYQCREENAFAYFQVWSCDLRVDQAQSAQLRRSVHDL